jgi:hypothetical protein
LLISSPAAAASKIQPRLLQVQVKLLLLRPEQLL